LKKIFTVLLVLADDILFLSGMGCITAAVWSVDPRAGLAVLGVSLVVTSIVIARGGRRRR
jgi:hypothetical protein